MSTSLRIEELRETYGVSGIQDIVKSKGRNLTLVASLVILFDISKIETLKTAFITLEIAPRFAGHNDSILLIILFWMTLRFALAIIGTIPIRQFRDIIAPDRKWVNWLSELERSDFETVNSYVLEEQEITKTLEGINKNSPSETSRSYQQQYVDKNQEIAWTKEIVAAWRQFYWHARIDLTTIILPPIALTGWATYILIFN